MDNVKVFTDFAGNHPGLFVFTMLMIVAIVGAVMFGIYKIVNFLVKKANIEVKSGDKSIKLNGKGGEKNNTEAQVISSDSVALDKLYLMLRVIIENSISIGFENCRKRQELFDTQMGKMRDNIDVIQTNIISSYMEKNGKNVEVARVLLYHCIRDKVIKSFRQICVADKLAEKTKEEVVDRNRNFIETSFHNVKIELKNLINYSNTPDDNTVFSYSILISCLDEQKDLFKRMLVSSLEFAYDEAVKSLRDIHNSSKDIEDKIQNVLQIHFNDLIGKGISLNLGDIVVPPNNIIGA